MEKLSAWESPTGNLGTWVAEDARAALEAYKIRPNLAREHDNIERSTVESGYGRKQLHELVQNAADAMEGTNGRICLILTEDTLYCANEGTPLDKPGLEALFMSHSSQKRDDKIGRFGLGFKSVLQVSDRPEIISRTVSVRWDREKSRRSISAALPGQKYFPVLRLAEAFDPAEPAKGDHVLAELMEWATTIVRLPLREGFVWLDDEFEVFPPEFMLFSEQIKSLELDNRRTGSKSSWTASRNGREVRLLAAGGEEVIWDVFSFPHQPTAEAMREAGSIAARSSLQVSWAVPRKNRGKRPGQFWNYFPTPTFTSLSGIVNAAFKLNEDRQNMLAGRYNEEILKVTLPRIVAAALPDLTDIDDPGSILDILPARFRPIEARSWADEVLNNPVMQAVGSMSFVPNLSGELRLASEIRIAPDLRDAGKIEALWDAAVPRGRPWAHRTTFATRDRNATLERLLGIAKVERATVVEWLEEVVYSGSLKDFASALEIAVAINKSHPELWADMRQAEIVLAGDGSRQKPLTSSIFIPVDDDDNAENLVSIELLAVKNVREYLRTLGIGLLDAQGQLRKVVALVLTDSLDDEAKSSMWRLARSVPAPQMVIQLQDAFPELSVPVRCEDGIWRRASDVWRRGGMFPANGTGDSNLVVDGTFHAADVELLRQLGIKTDLSQPAQTTSGPLYRQWREAQGKAIQNRFVGSPTPVSGIHLKFAPAFAVAKLELLTNASKEARLHATKQILRSRHYPVVVAVSNQYVADIQVDDPDLWWASQFGVVDTALGLIDALHAVGPVAGIPSGFLPTPTDPEAAALLRLQSDPARFNWSHIYRLAAARLSIPHLHQLYGVAAVKHMPSPKLVRVETREGLTELPFRDATLALDEATYRHYAENRGAAVIFTDNSELNAALENVWKLPTVSVAFTTQLTFTEEGPRQKLGERIPYIHIPFSGASKVELVPCSHLAFVTVNDTDEHRSERSLETHMDDQTFFFRSHLTPQRWLQALLEARGKRSTATNVLKAAKAAAAEADRVRRFKEIAKLTDDDEKLVALVGEQAIRDLIPPHVFQMLDHRTDEKLTGKKLAGLASTLHGASLFKKIKPFLDEQGIQTPAQFSGNAAAREFLKSLGISEDYFPTSSGGKKPPREEVVGPIHLSPMHDYQVDVGIQIQEVLAGKRKSRAIVQLPTGAGKTRVAVDSVIAHAATTTKPQLVVWVAHTKELCDQAVEAWLYVWQAGGIPGERLAVSRLWDSNDAKPEETRMHVVVATIQTLGSIVETRAADYEWLFDADTLIIDEAHGAIAPSYTEVFRAFGRTNADRGKPVIGLSATPYRGVNENETQRLVKRFDGQLLVPSQFDTEHAHTYLQDAGVLAGVRHESLEGIQLKLTAGATLPGRSTSAMLETRIDFDAVARNKDRNDAILDHVKSIASSQTALVFAASVDHAEALAATLAAEGISAAAISSKTHPADRRRQIEDFRNGKIRVLTNFDVLSQGFDAPKVGAVYVCRPTFAPNKYLQMIGRGLRGPMNGGSDEVLIVNVNDNIDQFGEKLAFNHFDYLWNRDS
ncbi:sacsin N-terminal ATP-binding-like domain-containing protein [Paenarthrobacter sp. NPDC091669]|uniref:DEAD/DEAH box helicase n=1 Tax=Paenarthrobacter sp. NPDC091669 TaxID=3364384 RepID=UPI00381D4C5A